MSSENKNPANASQVQYHRATQTGSSWSAVVISTGYIMLTRLQLAQLMATPRCCSMSRTVSALQSVETGYHCCPQQSARGAFLQHQLWTRPRSPREPDLLGHPPSLCLRRPRPDYPAQSLKVPRPRVAHQHLCAHLEESASCEARVAEGPVVYCAPCWAAREEAVPCPPPAFSSAKHPRSSSKHICPGVVGELQAEGGDVLARWAHLAYQQVFEVSREDDLDRLCQRRSNPISSQQQWPTR